MIIKIANWERYQPRKDVKSSGWIRVESNIIHSQSLFGLTAEQKWLWVVLLSLASRKSGGEMSIRDDYLAAVSGVPLKHIAKTVADFEKREMVVILDTYAAACAGVRERAETCSTDERTDERTDGLSKSTSGSTASVNKDELLKILPNAPSYTHEVLFKCDAKRLESFVNDYGKAVAVGKLEALTNYVNSTGRKYKCYVSTLRAWCQKDSIHKRNTTAHGKMANAFEDRK